MARLSRYSPAMQHPATPQNRWIIHATLLAGYPLAVGLAGSRPRGERAGPMLPADPAALLLTAGLELLLFAALFSLAWLASRCSKDQLLLRWHGGAAPLWQGLGYSLALRAGVMGALLLGMLSAWLLTGDPQAFAAALQPDTAQLVDASALAADPLYLGLNLTVTSFLVAGLREELWRAGLLAACFVLFPAAATSRPGRATFIVATALLFGLGHLVQGWGGVLLTTLLGIGLGWIMLHHRSIWPAVLAHGFFNATSFLLLRQFGSSL
jgi:membrane protease YdiL (CAAX protease family)